MLELIKQQLLKLQLEKLPQELLFDALIMTKMEKVQISRPQDHKVVKTQNLLRLMDEEALFHQRLLTCEQLMLIIRFEHCS